MIVAVDRIEYLRLRTRVGADLWPKFRTLTMFDTPSTFGDVANPWRQTEPVYEAAYDLIDHSCRSLLAKLLAALRAP